MASFNIIGNIIVNGREQLEQIGKTAYQSVRNMQSSMRTGFADANRHIGNFANQFDRRVIQSNRTLARFSRGVRGFSREVARSLELGMRNSRRAQDIASGFYQRRGMGVPSPSDIAFHNRTPGGGYGRQGDPGTYYHLRGMRRFGALRFSNRSDIDDFVKGIQNRQTGTFHNRAHSAFARTRDIMRSVINTGRRYSDMLRNIGSGNRRLANEQKKANAETRRQGVSFGNLLGLMIKFGIALELIMLPSRIIRGIGSIISAGAEWEQQLANIHSLITETQTGMVTLGRNISNIAIEYGAAGDLLQAGYEAASSLNDKLIAEASSMERYAKGVGGEAAATAALVDLAAKDAVAGVTSIETAMETIIRLQSGFRLSIKQTEEASNTIFNLILDGVVNYEKIAHHIGAIVGGIQQIWGSDDANKSLENLKGVSAALSVMTLTLPPEHAFTSMRNILQDLLKMPKEGQELVDILSQLGLVKLTPRDIIQQGSADTFRELHKVLSNDGPIVNMLAKQKTFNSQLDEMIWRQETVVKLQQMMFDNKRTIRGINAIVAGMELYEEHYDRVINKLDSREQAFQKNKDTIQNMFNQLKSLGTRLKSEFFWNMEGPLASILNPLSTGLQGLVNDTTFQNANFAKKFDMLWDILMSSAKQWLDSGGKQVLTTIFSTISQVFITVLRTVVDNKDFQMITKEIGISIAKGIITGFYEGLKDAPGGIFNFLKDKGLADYHKRNLSKDLSLQDRIKTQTGAMEAGINRDSIISSGDQLYRFNPAKHQFEQFGQGFMIPGTNRMIGRKIPYGEGDSFPWFSDDHLKMYNFDYAKQGDPINNFRRNRRAGLPNRTPSLPVEIDSNHLQSSQPTSMLIIQEVNVEDGSDFFRKLGEAADEHGHAHDIPSQTFQVGVA